jgi:hypothetical protein
MTEREHATTPRERMSEVNAVNHPPHYKAGEIETITIVDQITAHYPGDEAFSVGSALKYLARAPHKGAKLEDLRKARWYIDHAITLVEGRT